MTPRHPDLENPSRHDRKLAIHCSLPFLVVRRLPPVNTTRINRHRSWENKNSNTRRCLPLAARKYKHWSLVSLLQKMNGQRKVSFVPSRIQPSPLLTIYTKPTMRQVNHLHSQFSHTQTLTCAPYLSRQTRAHIKDAANNEYRVPVIWSCPQTIFTKRDWLGLCLGFASILYDFNHSSSNTCQWPFPASCLGDFPRIFVDDWLQYRLVSSQTLPSTIGHNVATTQRYCQRVWSKLKWKLAIETRPLVIVPSISRPSIS